MHLAALAAGLLCLASSLNGVAQGNRSLTDSGLVNSGSAWKPAGLGLSVAQEDSDYAVLNEQLVLTRATIKALTESLALANSEAEVFKRQVADLSLRIETLGLDSVDKNRAGLEQKLLAAVRDLRLMNNQNEEARNQLVRLTEAVLTLLANAENVDPQTRMAVETELRKTNEILGIPSSAAIEAVAVEPSLNDAMVVEVKDELSLIVANVGKKHQVRIGTPFQVWRGEEKIGEVRVVDVRDRISGAIIQNLEKETQKINVGDRLRVDAQR